MTLSSFLQPKQPRSCAFCKTRRQPDYKEVETLAKYLSPTAKIVPARRTSLCAKHQRRLREAIKRARFLALLPYTKL